MPPVIVSHPHLPGRSFLNFRGLAIKSLELRQISRTITEFERGNLQPEIPILKPVPSSLTPPSNQLADWLWGGDDLFDVFGDVGEQADFGDVE